MRRMHLPSWPWTLLKFSLARSGLDLGGARPEMRKKTRPALARLYGNFKTVILRNCNGSLFTVFNTLAIIFVKIHLLLITSLFCRVGEKDAAFDFLLRHEPYE